VARMIGESLRDQTIQMGLYEMETLLNRWALGWPARHGRGSTFTLSLTLVPPRRRFREALVDFGKEHRGNPNNVNNKFYLHYLLASISNCIILK